MECSVDEQDGIAVARPSGRVDEASWEAFAACLADGVETARQMPARKLVVDLAAVRYMSSRGLRALTLGRRAADAAEVSIVLAAPNELIREILSISRYDKLFVVTDTVEAAR
jgi:anti-sigma B factor antagonist